MNSLPSTVLSLLEGMKNQDAGSWTKFHARYHPSILARCTAFGLAEHDAEDVTQEIVLKLYTNLGRFDPEKAGGAFRPWLATLIKNALIDWKRKKKREPIGNAAGDSDAAALLAQLPAFEEGLVTTIEANLEFVRDPDSRLGPAIDRAREQAGDQTWMAFYKATVEGKSAQEVAGELHMSPSAVYKAKARVLRNIQSELEKE